MSEAVTEKKANANGMARLTVTLGAICAVCALILGSVNALTAERIAQIQQEKNAAAMAAVLPIDLEGGEAYEPVETTGIAAGGVQSIHKAADKGYVVEVAPGGSFSGSLTIMVGVSTEGTAPAVTGVQITKSGETSGLGDNAKKADFREQFGGLSGEVKVTKDGGVIVPITGATITSRAVSSGVTTALKAVESLG